MINSERYSRQILLPHVGTHGQEKLLSSKVLVIGSGGLGCPALQYLAAAGVGTIGICDFDNIELSNLHRQILFSTNDIGKPKAQIAKAKLQQLNPEINVIAHQLKLNNTNAIDLISDYDIVIDGTDNFETRYLINDACVLLKKPLVHGAVLKWQGQVAVFNVRMTEQNYSTNYRDLFPQPPDENAVLSCNEAGVMGVLPGIIGLLQATETIKFIIGSGDLLVNKLLTYDILNHQQQVFSIEPNPNAHIYAPQTIEQFKHFSHKLFCTYMSDAKKISPKQFSEYLQNSHLEIIDVRELNEEPTINNFIHTHIPLSTISKDISSLSYTGTVITFCNHGRRGQQAANILSKHFPEAIFINLEGGIMAWLILEEQQA
ncbi:MAG TPA: HesA/MoeB/ThiF family protein [Bacteroidia bacterium]|nr:HesA/MoeB/ThiF family protein [Bacteroidia bacterium]